MSRYRVIGKNTYHSGDVAEALDKAEVRRKRPKIRTDWYESWDILLDIDADGIGMGFMWSEVELVYESICAACDTPIEQIDYLCPNCRSDD